MESARGKKVFPEQSLVHAVYSFFFTFQEIKILLLNSCFIVRVCPSVVYIVVGQVSCILNTKDLSYNAFLVPL